MPVHIGHALFAYDEVYVFANRAEAGLWMVIGIGFLIAAIVRPKHRRASLGLAPVFIAFGFSDLVEVHYGQWWSPWWLLVWKGVCVLVFLYAMVRYAMHRRRVSAGADKNAEGDDGAAA